MLANKQSTCVRRPQRRRPLLSCLLLRPPSSPSQRCKVYTQKCVMPATPSLSSNTLAQDGQAADALTSDSMLLSPCLCFQMEDTIGNAEVLMLYDWPVVGSPSGRYCCCCFMPTVNHRVNVNILRPLKYNHTLSHYSTTLFIRKITSGSKLASQCEANVLLFCT